MWAKAPTNQTKLVELLKPLRVIDIGLSARDILDIARVHEEHFQATGFKISNTGIQ